MASTRTLSSARTTQTATLGDTLIAAGSSDTLTGSGNNSLVASANTDYLIAGTGANTLVGSTLSSNFTTLQGNGQSTLKYSGANNTIILNSSVAGGSGSDYKTDAIIAASGTALARSSIIQTSLNKFDLSNTLNHGAGVANITGLVYTGAANATLHGNNQNDSIVGGMGANSLSVAGTTGKSTLDGHFSKAGDTLVGNGFSSLIGSSLNDTYIVSETVTSGKVTQSDKIFENANGGINTVSISGVSGSSALFDLSNTTLNGNAILNVSNLAYSGNLAASLYGNSQNNFIQGGSGNNLLQGGGGSDTLDAHASNGNNTLIGSSNAAGSLIGGSGNNSFYLYNAADTLKADPNSTNQLFVATSQVNLSSYANFNITGITFLTKGGGSTITGGANGHQTINAAGASSTYLSDGGNPTDKLIGSATGPNVFVVASLGAGADTVVGGTGPGTLTTGNVTLADTAFSSPYLSGVQTINLTNRARISLGSGAATEGISTVIAAPGNVYVDASQFSSNLYVNSSASTLANTLIGSSLTTGTLLGGSGNDSLVVNTAQLASDSISGGAGSDTLLISSAAPLGDTAFAGVSGVEALQLTSNSIVTLGTFASAAGFATIVAGSGSDTVNASGFSRSMTLDGISNGTASLSYVSSNRGDLIRLNASARSTSSVTGGTGTDTLAINGQVSALNDSFSNLSSLEVLSLSGASNSITLGSGAATAGIRTLVAASGGDTINAGAFSSTLSINASTASQGETIVASSLSSTNVQTGSGADFISVSNTRLAGDTISGGAGTDTLAITGGSATLSSFANISGIEVLSLSGGHNKLSTIGSGMTLVAGGVSGGDSIDASASNTSIRIDASAATLGDYFVLSSSQITTDTLTGGSGTDTLQIAGGGASLSTFANITGIEVLSLQGGNNSVSNLPSGLTLVSGGVAGGDTINASASTGQILLDGSGSTLGDSLIASTTSVSTLLGGSGNDAFSVTASRLTADKISGGAGSNTLTVSTSGNLSDPAFSNITGIQALRITSPTAVTLGSYASATGISTLVTGTGSDTVNASSLASGLTLDASSANTTSVNYTGSNNGDLILIGSPALAGSTIAGGGGTDTLAVTTGGNLADSSFTNDTSLEVLKLVNSSSVTLGSQARSAGISTLVTGTGSDSINAAGFTSGLRVDASAGATTALSYLGSSIGDLVKVNSSTIPSDSIAGGSGTDTLLIANGNATLSAFTNVSGMELLSLAGGNNLVNGIARGMTTVAGSSSGHDTIDATAFATAITINESASTLGDTLIASSVASTTLLGGSGNDSLAVTSQRFPGDSFNGGSGSDSLTILNGSAYLSNFSRVSNVANLLLTGGHNTLNNLSNSGISLVQGGTLGGDLIDASNSWGNITVNEAGSSLGDTLLSSTIGSGILGTGAPVGSLLIGSSLSANYFVQGFTSDTDPTTGINLLSQATVYGGSGIDTLQLGAPGDGVSGQTLGDSVFGNGADTSIEVLKLAGSTYVSLGSAAYLAGISTIIGGTGNDSIDASAFNLGQSSPRGLTIDLTANAGGQSYDTATGASDLVIVASSLISGGNLSHYKLNGGGGIDTLQVVGNFSLGSFANLQSFEVVSLSGSANSLAGMGSSGTRTVIGSAGGKDTIDASTGVNPVYINAAASSLGDTLAASSVTGVASTLVGSSLRGNMFVAGVTAAQLAVDSIVGGNGTDTLVLTGSDTFIGASFNNIRSVEVLSLTGSAGTYVSLTGVANNAGISSVVGAIGTNDTLDASNFNNGATSVRGLYFDLTQNASLSGTNSSLAASGGNDLIRLTSGLLNNNFLYTHNDTINGGAGSDTLQISDTLPVSLTNFSPVISIEALSLAGGNDTFTNLGTSSNPGLPGSGLATVIGGSLGGDSVDASNSRVGFLYNGASGIYGDTLTAVNTPTIVGANLSYLTSTLIGSQTAGNEFIASGESALQAASLVGGTGSDTLLYGGGTLKTGDFSKDAGASIDVLQLNGSGGSDYALFGDAQAAGISKIVDLTAGANTLDASRYDYGSLVLDASQTTTYADTLIGGSGSSVNTLIGSRVGANSFYLNSSSALDSVVGNTSAVDTLTFLTGSQAISDNIQGRSVEVLSLSGSANSIYLGANAQATGFSSVFGGTAGNNSISAAGITKGAVWIDASQGVLGSTLAAGGSSAALSTTTTLIGSTNAKASNVYQIGAASLLGNDSIYGSGAGHNLLQVTTAGQTLNDSLFAKMGSLAYLDQISLKGGNNLLQLGASASLALHGAVLSTSLAGGGVIVTVTGGAGKDTLDLSGFGSQNVLVDGSASGLGDSIVAGSGHETLLGGAPTTANNYFLLTKAALTSPVYSTAFDASIVGGNGTNTLELNSSGQLLSLSNGYTQLNGRGFSSNVSGIDVLYLNGFSDTLNLNGADAAGITTVVGGKGPSTIDGTNYVSGNQNLYWDLSMSNGGDSLIGGAVGPGNVGNVFRIKNDANLANTHITGSLHGGLSVDTLQIVQGAQTIGDDDFSLDSNLGSIVLGSSSQGNSITVGSNAAAMAGTSTTLSITAGTSKDTVNAASYTRNIWVNAAAGSGDSLIAGTSGNTLIGATSGGNTFVLGTAVNGASLVGASNGLDTLQFSGTVGIDTGTNTSDLLGISNIGTLELLAGNNLVNLSLDAAQEGIRTIVLGQQGDSVSGDVVDGTHFGFSPLTFLVTDQYYLNNSYLVGGQGSDTLKFSRDGISMTEADFANIQNIEVIQSANGNNHFMITDAAEASGVQTIMGGTGRDTIDLTDTYIGYTPNRTITYDLSKDGSSGGGGYTVLSTIDRFYNTAGNTPVAATRLIGGAGANMLVLTAGSNLSDVAFSNQNQANIGTLDLEITGVNAVLGTNAKAAGIKTVYLGLNDNGDVIDATGFSGPLTIKGQISPGNSAVKIQPYYDGVQVRTSYAELSNLTYNAHPLAIVGGINVGGNDSLVIVGSDARAITSDSLTGTFDALVLGNGNNFVQLTGADSTGLSSIFGGTGRDTIVARGFTDTSTAYQPVDIIVQAGNLSQDSLEGGFIYAGDQAHSDTVSVANGSAGASQTIADTDFLRMTHIQAFAMDSSAATNLTVGTDAGITGISSIYGGTLGGDQVNASGATSGIDFILSSSALLASDSFTGSAFNDTLSVSSGNIADADLATGYTSVEALALNYNTGGSITVDVNAATEGIKSLYGGSGSDTFTATKAFTGSSLTMKGWIDSGNTSSDTYNCGTNAETIILGDSIGNAYGNEAKDSSGNYYLQKAKITGFNITNDTIQLHLFSSTAASDSLGGQLSNKAGSGDYKIIGSGTSWDIFHMSSTSSLTASTADLVAHITTSTSTSAIALYSALTYGHP